MEAPACGLEAMDLAVSNSPTEWGRPLSPPSGLGRATETRDPPNALFVRCDFFWIGPEYGWRNQPLLRSSPRVRWGAMRFLGPRELYGNDATVLAHTLLVETTRKRAAEKRADTRPRGWAAIRSLVGSIQAPPDFAIEIDHYLYGVPKHDAAE